MLGQLVRRGVHIAELDDTGNSAMEHLHFHSDATSGTTDVNLPIVFRDVGTMRSTTFVTSDTAVSERCRSLRWTSRCHSRHTGPHPHPARRRLRPAGRRDHPASVTVSTDGPGHRHELTLTADQIRQLLRHRDVVGVASTSVGGHSHATAGYGALRHERGAGRARRHAAAPAGRLVARRPTPLNLLGEQLYVRVDGRATEWFTWGEHRPRAPAGDVTLDRGCRRGALSSDDGDPAVATHVMARSAARALSTGDVAVRVVPVLVLETRQRWAAARPSRSPACPTASSLSSPGAPDPGRSWTSAPSPRPRCVPSSPVS